MLNKDDQIDNLIREALSKEDQEVFDQVFDEPSVFEMVTSSFTGKLRWLSFFAIAMGIVLMVVGVFALLRFVATEDVPSMLRWGALLFFSLIAVMSMKIWHWMEMQRYALTREIKRLELQVANLATEVGSRRSSSG
jgi:protein-S-isoprenylcysteine O-methyltransferase Ste14